MVVLQIHVETPAGPGRKALIGVTKRVSTSSALTVSTYSDANGLAELELEPDQYDIAVFLDGYVAAEDKVLLVREDAYVKRRYVLALGFSLCGIVLDPESIPLKEAEVAVVLGQSNEPSCAIRTGSKGEFSLKGLTSQCVALRVRHSHHQEVLLKDIRVSDYSEAPIRVVLKRGRELSGRVVSENGGPVAGALVVAHNERGGTSETDRDGHFQICSLGSGDVTVFVVFGKQTKGFGPLKVGGSGHDLIV